MTLRVKIVLIALLTVAGFLVVFSAVSIVQYFRKGKTQMPTAQEQQAASGQNQLGTPLSATTPGQQIQEQTQPLPPPPPAKPGDEIISFAVPFVERFGSYSNQGNFENLSDLLPFMSDTMRVWAEKEIKKQMEKPFQELYRGVTTKALSYAVTRYEPEKKSAEMKITTQRKELIGNTVNARVYNQDVIVTLAHSDGVWLVDSAFWQ